MAESAPLKIGITCYPSIGGSGILASALGDELARRGHEYDLISYGPAIRHALRCSDALTAVSAYLEGETRRLLDLDRPIEVIPNFFAPHPPRRTRQEVREELGIRGDQALVLHSSNLRPVKRIDLI